MRKVTPHQLIPIFLYLSIAVGCTKTTSSGDSSTTTPSYSGVASTASGIGSSGGSNNGNPGTDTTHHTAGLITAGEWNDLDNWAFWKQLQDTATWADKQTYWKFSMNDRYSVQLTDQNNKKIIDAIVSISTTSGQQIWSAKTDNAGKAEFFPSIFSAVNLPLTVKATVNSQTFTIGQFTSGQHIIQQKLDVFRNVPNKVQVMYVVDATGSMGDEISYLKNELNDVLSRAQNDLSGLNLEVGSVFYRDHVDEWLTRSFPFTSNIPSLIDFIKQQSAAGGGDYPEAVDAALEEAIQKTNWSSSAISRIIFMVLDAPPHHTDDVIQSIQESVKQAAAKGIKIIPISASGIDKDTEFFLRYIDIATNGTYVFITNDSGIGNNHIAATVGPYQVEYLNNLMERLIKKYAKVD